MKKILSLSIIMTMLLSLVSLLGVSASAANDLAKKYEDAKDGDVIYNVLFNQTEGAYVPKVYAAGSESIVSSTKVDIAADGKSVTFKHSSESGRFWWGAPIEGLTLGADKSYTIEATITAPCKNCGFYFTYTAPESEDVTKNYVYQKAMGFYGNENAGSIMYGGDQLPSTYVCTGEATEYWYNKDLGGLYDLSKKVTIVIKGYDVYFYFNNHFFDMATLPAWEEYDNLGISAYLYNDNSEMTIADVVIKKGAALVDSTSFPSTRLWLINKNPADPAYQAKDYNTAKDGEKLLDINFLSRTGAYAPSWSKKVGVDDLTTIIGSTSATITKAASGQAWYGGVINGLKMGEDLTYTYQFKVKNTTAYAGGVYLTSGTANNLNFETRVSTYGVYGNFSDLTDTRKLKMGPNGDAADGYDYDDVKYSEKVNPLLDTQGFADVRVVIKGYDYLVYIMDESNEYKLVSTVDLTKEAFAACDNLAFYVYSYTGGKSITVKDAAVFKGDLMNPAPVVPDTPDVPDVPTGDSTLVLTVLALISVLSLAGVKLSRKSR